MSTGWKYVTSDGQEFKSQVQAKEYLRTHPDIRIYFSELSMAGTKETDVTQQFRDSLKNIKRTEEWDKYVHWKK